MKKLIFGACAALLMVASACSKGGDTATSQIPKELSDSVSNYFGHVYGGYVLADFQRYSPDNQEKSYKNAVLNGIQLALNNMDNEGTLIGMQIGGQLANQMKAMQEQGVAIDKVKMMKEFRRAFEADSLNMTAIQECSATLDGLMQRVHAIKSQEDLKQENALMEKIKTDNPNIKTTESGLSYVITEPGTEPAATDTSTVVVNYVGKLADGTVFDQSQEGQPATFGVNQVIPGFREGLKLVGKGGKATLYIPGNLAYGEQGVPQAGIGPNAMLIFDIEVVDIK